MGNHRLPGALFQKQRDGFERHCIKLVYSDVQFSIDETVAFIVSFFEAITLTFRNLPNYILALYIFTETNFWFRNGTTSSLSQDQMLHRRCVA
jgi:hypothetical protein